jgi:hypothetical protein
MVGINFQLRWEPAGYAHDYRQGMAEPYKVPPATGRT